MRRRRDLERHLTQLGRRVIVGANGFEVPGVIGVDEDPAEGRAPTMGRLLIFDDEEIVGEMLGMLAEEEGMATRVVTRSGPFLETLATWAPTHIAVDLLMPEMDGVQVLRLLAARDCTSMIIITSGVGGRILDAARRAAEAYRLNIAGVLPKPFDMATLRRLLGKRPPSAAPGPAASATEPEITEGELRRALDGRELELAYQPKIDCATGRVAGFEALARWRRPGAELVMPDRFIPLAERGELIGVLTEQVCDQALRWLAGLRTPLNLAISINISNRNLGDHGLADRLASLCAELGLDPARVILELTETAAMEDPAASLALLTRFRMKRFHLSIDDFGAGYSSMVQLVRLPFTEMKVDKSFVINAATSEESRTVIRSIVDLGHSLGLTLTAEGVEDATALKFLVDVGCDLAQGYYIARPMPADKVAGWLARRQATHP